MTETVLWLIRHPEPDHSARGLCYGALDIALSDSGIRHAHAISEKLVNENFAAIYSSPKQRCTVTARLLARGRSVETVGDLRELDFGKLEGRSYEEIAASYPDVYKRWMENPTGTEFPDGESFCQMSTRVLGVLNELLARHAGESIAVVTHGGPIRVMLADALGIPLRNIFRIEQHYGAISRLRYRDGMPSVDLVNCACGPGSV